MGIAHHQDVLTHRDSTEAFAAKSLARGTKVAICVALVLGILAAVAAVEIGLLQSGSLVVVMPE